MMMRFVVSFTIIRKKCKYTKPHWPSEATGCRHSFVGTIAGHCLLKSDTTLEGDYTQTNPRPPSTLTSTARIPPLILFFAALILDFF